LRDIAVVEPVLQMGRQLQIGKNKEGKYLTFAFFEKARGMELEVVGWTKLRPLPHKHDCIKGVVNPWGCEIPVFDLRVMYGTGRTAMTSTTCIVIFEHYESYKYYFGMVVEEPSNVANIAEGIETKMSSLLSSAKRHLSVSPAVKN
jgi:chemotaxis signal transduction protein